MPRFQKMKVPTAPQSSPKTKIYVANRWARSSISGPSTLSSSDDAVSSCLVGGTGEIRFSMCERDTPERYLSTGALKAIGSVIVAECQALARICRFWRKFRLNLVCLDFNAESENWRIHLSRRFLKPADRRRGRKSNDRCRRRSSE